jgi:hypothetical protein
LQKREWAVEIGGVVGDGVDELGVGVAEWLKEKPGVSHKVLEGARHLTR